jgi:hypothetical protein
MMYSGALIWRWTFLAACFYCLSFGDCHGQQSEIDFERVRANGLEVQTGRHLTLITDARERADVQEFVPVFDLAVQQWCDYFAVDPQRAADWRMIGCVIVDIERFKRAGLIPESLPVFPAGFQRGDMMWLYVQTGDYYTRHLLLHEGTHAFMQHFLGDFGPPWYAEGMAELLGVHQWSDGKLTLKHQIANKDEVPWWGRVKLVRDDFASENGLTLDDVLTTPAGAFGEVHAYGRAWAACEFFDRHPGLQQAFRQLPATVQSDHQTFNRQFRQSIAKHFSDWSEVEFQWQQMLNEIDYGYAVEAAVPFDAPVSKFGDTTSIQLSVTRGWQRAGVQIVAGQSYDVSCENKFRIRDDGQPWPCTADGVTIEYYRGRPLGQLVGAVRGSHDSTVLDWVSLGSGGIRSFDSGGELYLRINESPAGLADNSGELTVTIRPVSD